MWSELGGVGNVSYFYPLYVLGVRYVLLLLCGFDSPFGTHDNLIHHKWAAVLHQDSCVSAMSVNFHIIKWMSDTPGSIILVFWYCPSKLRGIMSHLLPLSNLRKTSYMGFSPVHSPQCLIVSRTRVPLHVDD